MSIDAVQQIPIPRAAQRRPAPGAASDLILDVLFVHQVEDNWCWAACCEMLVRWFQKPLVTRCQIASKAFGKICCTNPVSNDCDRGEFPEATYHHHGVNVVLRNRTLTPAEVKAQLSMGRPVEVYYVWNGRQSAHVALITGLYANGDVEVLDPWYGKGPRSFDFVRDAYGLGGAWEATYETRTK